MVQKRKQKKHTLESDSRQWRALDLIEEFSDDPRRV
jgi:hypothetical protein